MDCSTPGFQFSAIFESLFKFISIDLVRLSNHLIFFTPVLFWLQSFPASGYFPIRWLKYWSFNYGNYLSNEYSGLISFRINWFELLAVQMSFPALQIKSINYLSLNLILSHPYMTTRKPIVWLYGPLLTKWCLSLLIHWIEFS